MPQNTKEEFHELMMMVRDKKLSIDEADIHARSIFTSALGEQEELENNVSGFPERWGNDPIAAKKTWVHARNHLRRGIIARYGN